MSGFLEVYARISILRRLDLATFMDVLAHCDCLFVLCPTYCHLTILCILLNLHCTLQEVINTY